MRITNSMMVNNMLTNIGKNLQRMDKLQNQMSTGKRIQYPSDDPVIAARALKLRTDVAEVEQFKRNSDDAMSWIDTTESALDKIGEALKRTRELTVKGASGTLTVGDSKIISTEIGQLKQQITGLANTTYAGRYVFSGFKTDQPLLDTAGKYAVSVDKTTENIEFQLGIGDNIKLNVPGGELFGSATPATTVGGNPDMMKMMDDIISALNAGDNVAVSNLIGSVDIHVDNAVRIRSDIGARTNRIELTQNRLNTDEYNFTKLMSENEDADMAEIIMNLKNEENVYRASLSGGAKIIQPSLVDFLR